MKILGFLKRGKGLWGKSDTKLKPEDILLIQSVSATDQIENKGADGKNPYLSAKDIKQKGQDGIIQSSYFIHKTPGTFIHEVGSFTYSIRGVVYTNPIMEVTPDPANVDPNINREDLVVLTYDDNGNGIVKIKKGEEVNGVATAPVPIVGEELFLTTILVNGNTTEPGNVSDTILYDEDFARVEANNTDVSQTNVGASFGQNCIEVNDFTTGESFFVKNDVDFNPRLNEALLLNIATLSGTWDNRGTIKVVLIDSNNVRVSNQVIIDSRLPNNADNPYAFNSRNNSWQSIIIPMSIIAPIGTEARGIEILKDDNRGTDSFKLDMIRLQAGIYTPPGLEKTKLSEFENDVPYTKDEDLANVAKSGNYSDLINLPDINSVNISTDTTNFDNNLNSTHDTIQKVADAIDEFKLSGESSAPPVDGTYENITQLIADQNNQQTGFFYKVTDASDDGVNGKAIYEYLGTTVGDMTDYELIWKLEGDVVSGSELPIDAEQGLYFRLDKANRTVLMQFDGAIWNPIRSFGEMTIWVNSLGTDEPQFGDSAGVGAYKTIQYAVDQIPPQFYGDVYVIIQSGTYNEDVVISGKSAIGDYNIKITGEYTSETGTSSSISYESNGRYHVNDTSKNWSVNTHKYKFIHITSGLNAGSVLPIYSNSSNQLVLTSYNERGYRKDSYAFDINNLFTQNTSNCSYEITTLNSVINGVITSDRGMNFSCQFLRFNVDERKDFYGFSIFNACQFYVSEYNSRLLLKSGGNTVFSSCSLWSNSTAFGLVQSENSNLEIFTTYFDHNSGNLNGLLFQTVSFVLFYCGIIEGNIRVEVNSSLVVGWSTATIITADQIEIKTSSVGLRTSGAFCKVTTLIVDGPTYGVSTT